MSVNNLFMDSETGLFALRTENLVIES